jgi:hypothetical protein
MFDNTNTHREVIIKIYLEAVFNIRSGTKVGTMKISKT